MNNRIEDFLPVRDSGAELREFDVPQAGASKKYVSLVKQWAARNPVRCLAAAFAFGVAVAWIIKRK